jgi:prephenate dehydrogenase
MTLRHVKIVGSGLIGSSIGLALTAKGVEVTMSDIDPATQALAQDLMGGSAADLPVDLVIIASPVSTISQVIDDQLSQGLNCGFMDISSVKTNPLLQVSSSQLDRGNFLPSHPMAGREVGGAESARADLFNARPWIVDATGVNGDLLNLGREVIEL